MRQILQRMISFCNISEMVGHKNVKTTQLFTEQDQEHKNDLKTWLKMPFIS